jgi:hypothetical protein
MRRKLPALVLVALTYLAQLMVFGGFRWELAYTFHHALGDRARHLPSLTTDFSLAILGPGGLDGRPAPLFYVFWTLVFLPPAILGWRTWKDSSELVTLQRFVYWGGSYALAVAFAYALVLFGLWLPFSAA